MTCEHCGKFVEAGGGACPACGVSLRPPRQRSASGKVVPFRPRTKSLKKKTAPVSGRYRNRTLWWIVAIIGLAILIPYLWSIH